MRHLFHIPILLLLLSSCFGKSAPSAADTALLLVDSIIDDRPDSALTLLRAIDTTAFVHPESRPLYALLLTQAEDKNFIDRTSDTLISRATAYYSRHPRLSPTRLIRAHYYHARILLNARNYPLSLIHLRQAEELALPDSAHHLLGLIYRNMADIYFEIHIAPEQVRCAQLSLRHFKTDGDTLFITDAYLDLARAYLSNNNRLKTLETIDAIPTDTNYLSPSFMGVLHTTKARAFYLDDPDYSEIINQMHQAKIYSKTYMTWTDYTLYINALTRMGKYNEAKSLCQEAKELFPSQFYTPRLLFLSENNYKEAYESLLRENSILDSISWAMMQQNVTNTINTYNQQSISLRDNEISNHKARIRLTTLFSACIILLIAVIGILFYRKTLQKRRIALLEIDSLKADLLRTSDSNNLFRQQISNLFASRFQTLDQLCATYYERENKPNRTSYITREIMAEIESIKTDDSQLARIEAEINRYHSNLMADFRKDFSDLTPIDFRLFILSVAGFSNKALSIFLDCRVENLYTLKSRLRKKIQATPTPRRDQYLLHL